MKEAAMKMGLKKQKGIEADLSKTISDTDYVALIKSYENALYKIAYIYVQNEADALEAVSETVYRSYKNRKSLKETQNFKTWITRILINVCNTFLKRKKKFVVTDTVLQEGVNHIVNDSLSENKMVLEEALMRLRHEYKSVLILRYYQDFSVYETAQAMKVPGNTVKTYTRRALDEIRQYLKEDIFYE